MQMVFQDPFSSLNPGMTIRGILSEPLKTHQRGSAAERERRIKHLMELVGLSNQLLDRRPHRLSGGQRQRIALARAISTEPQLLVADEPVSALDVSVRASILNLLRDLHDELNFACLLITHDLSVVEFLCHSVSVMYLGQVVETAPTDQLFRDPKHPYTRSLLAATLAGDPGINGKRVPLRGDVPSPLNPPSGCHFHTRCPIAELPLCKEEAPVLRDVGTVGHEASCHLIDQ
jgi:oligopeptide/dipeptide ABC transporter ATP-binding protein